MRRSLVTCAVPTPGDTVLVQVNLTFPGNGAEDQILFANADRSWSGNPMFSFSGVARKATISAECMDYNGFSAVPYAQYGSHVTMLSGG